MPQAQTSNPNDFKVVSFHNSTNFRFTPDMGCMYDGRPINSVSGGPGIDAGESMILPYHVGHQLAINLAKRVLNTSQAAIVDQAGIPTGVPIWNKDTLPAEKAKYLKELYTEAKPAAMSETDKLMAKVEEYKKMVEEKLGGLPKLTEEDVSKVVEEKTTQETPTFLDKQQVIEELEKRGIKHDKRWKKVELEKLLA